MRRLIAIGASMGGIAALESLISRLPADTPPILIVQHILPTFSRRFVERLNGVGHVAVVEAADGQPLLHGRAYLPPAHHHLLVRNIGGELRAGLSSAPPVRFHRPSVDMLFQSLTTLDGVGVVAVLLTGMGSDGAEGLLALRQRGAQTIVQDELSSAIFGMPKAAISRGAASRIVSLDDLPGAILASLTAFRLPSPGRLKAGLSRVP